jgi:hypothetical protein
MDTQALVDVIDIHAHCGPDSIPREIDALDLARMAKDHGMRGVVLKNHHEPTASLAYIVRKEVPDIAVFGGITLNLAVGGVNPAAVESMAVVTGQWGRFVWMGSLDTEWQVRYGGDERAFVSVSAHGELLPETRRVLSIIAKYDLVLATGHSSPEECLMILREGKRQGVRHMVVTHAMMAPIHMPYEQMQEATNLGAYIEFVYNGLIGPHKEFGFEDYARAIQHLGADHCVLASDLGQRVNPPHPDGLIAFFAGLRKAGLSEAEIHRMSKNNPALLLGLT